MIAPGGPLPPHKVTVLSPGGGGNGVLPPGAGVGLPLHQPLLHLPLLMVTIESVFYISDRSLCLNSVRRLDVPHASLFMFQATSRT